MLKLIRKNITLTRKDLIWLGNWGLGQYLDLDKEMGSYHRENKYREAMLKNIMSQWVIYLAFSNRKNRHTEIQNTPS
jgi:hypothetical protein